jgi:hypothetical protein
MKTLNVTCDQLDTVIDNMDPANFPHLLMVDGSQEAADAEKLLRQEGITFRTTRVEAEGGLGPTLATDLGIFNGIHRIRGFIEMEKNGFNLYARDRLKKRRQAI